jgi:hypothetical protein
MRKWLLALALLLNHGLIADRAHAQAAPADVTLTVNAADLQILATALGTQPYGTVAPLMAKLQGQVLAQQAPKKEDRLPVVNGGAVPLPTPAPGEPEK